MVKQWISPETLGVLNMVLDQDPTLRAQIRDAMQIAATSANRAAASLADVEPQTQKVRPQEGTAPGQEPTPSQTLTASLEGRILDWFQTHPGKHPMAACRADLGVLPSSKPFKTAVQHLTLAGDLKSSGKRGKGSEYWLAPKKGT